ncbi:hypothetical protein RJ640_008715 [Escallonia rubra]|uniref:Ribosomal RNA-processing protein 7 C-terminal domain-containing protein n=1 Tax=Escallonia rubra TaxID=112253 RepID=A0AA88UL00_9ASTE|nr:hypothetical protein RJ640_008715 [Escallonia rubra]
MLLARLLPRSSSNGTSIVSTLCVAVASLMSAAVTPPSSSLADPVTLTGLLIDLLNKSDGEKKKNKILKNKNMKNDKIIEVGMEDDLDEQNDANEAEGKESSKSRKKKRKSEKVKKAATNNVDELENEIEDGSYQQNGDENAEVIQSTSQGSKGQFAADDETNVNTRKSKKACKMKKELVLSRNDDRSVEKGEGLEEDEVYEISSGDEDCSRGKKKWITEYYQRRPGVKILQQRIDDFVIAHDAQEEQARKEREARAAEGGWTVVVHHKGRKKTTDTESGIVVGSVAQAAIMDKMDKKKSKEVGLDFYRFQKRESKRNEIGTLVVILKHGRRIRMFSLGFGTLDACLLCDDMGLAELEQGSIQ